MVSDDTNLLLWPCIDTGEDKIDPLRDCRVVEVLRDADVEEFCITPLELGAYGEEKHKLRLPCIMTTNTRGEILVLYREFFWKSQIEVFSSSGEHIQFLPISLPVPMSKFAETAIDTDQSDNIYLIGHADLKGLSVFVFDKNMTLQQEYNPKGMELAYGRPWVVSDNTKLFVLNVASDIQVFDIEKHFVIKRLGAGMLNNEKDITYVNAGKVMVLFCDIDGGYLVHLCSEYGECLSQFKLAKEQFIPRFIKFHHPNEQVLVLSESKDTHSPVICTELLVSLYSIDGVFIRDIRMSIPAKVSPFEGVKRIAGIAVTKEGRVAICDRKRILLV